MMGWVALSGLMPQGPGPHASHRQSQRASPTGCDVAMRLRAKLLTEFVGTFMFLTVIALVPGIGALGPIAVGFALMAMVYMGGHVSGAHYNPAVSFGLYLRRVISVETMIWYWLLEVLP